MPSFMTIPYYSRSVSQNRLSVRKPLSSRIRKSSGNDDALSATGTYTMDEADQDHKKVRYFTWRGANILSSVCLYDPNDTCLVLRQP